MRCLAPVAQCGALEELWAGKNKVEALGGALGGLGRLRVLDVQSNRLTALEGLEAQAASLEELYLARNGIASLAAPAVSEGGGESEGAAAPPLASLQALSTLDVSNNRLVTLDGLESCAALEEVWASANHVEDLPRALRPLQKLRALTCIYLEHNPGAGEGHPGGEGGYRAEVRSLLPGLAQIDATPAGAPPRGGAGGLPARPAVGGLAPRVNGQGFDLVGK